MEAAVSLRSSPARRSTLHDSPDLDDIFARYLDPIYRFLYTRVGNREDAEDLTSEVFLKAARQLDSGRAEASIAQWLYTVARTVLADHWRRYYRGGTIVPLDETRAAEIPDRETAGPSERSAQMVEDILHALSDRYRQVLELRFLKGYSIQETAQEMNVTPENCKVLQHRALAKAVELAGDRL